MAKLFFMASLFVPSVRWTRSAAPTAKRIANNYLRHFLLKVLISACPGPTSAVSEAMIDRGGDMRAVVLAWVMIAGCSVDTGTMLERFGDEDDAGAVPGGH